MKRILCSAVLGLGLLVQFEAHAQVQVNVQVGRPVVQERWYTTDNDYYYLPERQVYYNVNRRVYVFPEGGTWVYAPSLPARYGNYTYRTSKYVRINDRSPFQRHNVYKQRYHSVRKDHPHKNGHPGKGKKKGHNKH